MAFLHFPGLARGSLSELDTQLVIAREPGYAAASSTLDQCVDKVFGLLGGLINSLKETPKT